MKKTLGDKPPSTGGKAKRYDSDRTSRWARVSSLCRSAFDETPGHATFTCERARDHAGPHRHKDKMWRNKDFPFPVPHDQMVLWLKEHLEIEISFDRIVDGEGRATVTLLVRDSDGQTGSGFSTKPTGELVAISRARASFHLPVPKLKF